MSAPLHVHPPLAAEPAARRSGKPPAAFVWLVIGMAMLSGLASFASLFVGLAPLGLLLAVVTVNQTVLARFLWQRRQPQQPLEHGLDAAREYEPEPIAAEGRSTPALAPLRPLSADTASPKGAAPQPPHAPLQPRRRPPVPHPETQEA
ncbi:MAG: hypothetical protein JNJ71_01350 [Rubrivivax sp.]|nr:hypothetical protein [Rubrivivax sp.]